MNENEMKNDGKPVLKPENIISLLQEHLPEIKKYDGFYLSVIIGPNYDNLRSETNCFLRDMYDNQKSFENHIDSLKSAVIEQDLVSYTNENNIDYVLRMLDEIPEDLKIYYLAYDISDSIEIFYFNKECPIHDTSPGDEPKKTDIILDKIKQKYQPLLT
ncbi:MAG: hypothetical protein KAS11_04655 [Candidatus Aenigmarchaeota archaeon]|nr:hypothetical protein [Candidatus Aenigmarchaeota archaeon]MCK5043329.1 hypothetical protein [Candidatus Aenigmarchaeota archaeon]MCK5062391.1 hypothetical protein [Candidatus Aenigmarchaeota archaeon]